MMWLCLHEWEYWNVCIVVQYHHEPCRCFFGLFLWLFLNILWVILNKGKKKKTFLLDDITEWLWRRGVCVCADACIQLYKVVEHVFSFFILYSVLHITFSMYNSI